MTLAYAILAGVLGLVIGSFLNVVIWRLPRGESLVSPTSHCPGCDEPIKPWHNVPVISWLALRGRCAHCREPISPRYPLVEVLTGALAAGCVVAYGADRDVWLPLLLVLALVPIAFIDLDHRIIPNVITGPAAIAAIAVAAAIDSGSLVERLIAGAAAGGFFLVAALAYPAGMGMGDVKLAGVLGLYLGRAVAPAVALALLFGVVVGGMIMARVGVQAGRKTAVPFGPFLASGGVIALFAGDAIVDGYLDHFT